MAAIRQSFLFHFPKRRRLNRRSLHLVTSRHIRRQGYRSSSQSLKLKLITMISDSSRRA